MNYYKESDNMNEIDKSYEEVTFDKLYDTVASYITKSSELDTITKEIPNIDKTYFIMYDAYFYKLLLNKVSLYFYLINYIF